MLSLSKTETVSFDREVDTAVLPEHLAMCLRGVEAEDVHIVANRVTFRGGVFRMVWNWNVLVPFGFGDLMVDSDNCEVRYTLSYRQLVVFATGVVTVMLVFVSVLSAFRNLGILLVLLLMWFFMVFGNLGIGFARFRSFVDRALASAPHLPISQR